MSSSYKQTKIVQDLILFYVKENYKKYLEDHEIKVIPENEVSDVVNLIYIDRKPHLKNFLKSSLEQVMGQDYIGDLGVQSICNDIFSDDDFCKNRIIMEINLYQKRRLE